MTSSLVGSEMCIRDSRSTGSDHPPNSLPRLHGATSPPASSTSHPRTRARPCHTNSGPPSASRR
eukprot:4527407-Prorocentrum_lima.AAC.1